jgi:hypothetical protein
MNCRQEAALSSGADLRMDIIRNLTSSSKSRWSRAPTICDHRQHTSLVRIASSIDPDMIFGKDRCQHDPRDLPLLFFHVAISLVGIAAGLVVFYGLLTGKAQGGWTVVFLATTMLNSLTTPTQSEAPFLNARVLVLAQFVGLGIVAVKRFRRLRAFA